MALISRQIACFNTDTTCLKGKAHYADYPKLAAIEYSMASGSSLASDGDGRIEMEETRMASRCIFLIDLKKDESGLEIPCKCGKLICEAVCLPLWKHLFRVHYIGYFSKR